MKRSSTSLIIREMQIKIIIRYHFTPVRMAIITRSTKNKAREGRQKREPSKTFGGNVNWYNHYREQCGGSLRNKKQNYHIIQQPHTGHISGENHNSKRYMQPNVHCSTIYHSQDMEATCICIDRSMDQEDGGQIYNAILLSHIKNEIMPSAAPRINREIIILSESEKDRHHMISLICRI